MIPAHVKRHRIHQCLIDPHGIGPKPKAGHCAACGLAVLAAWEDGHGQTVIVDTHHLSSLGELYAALASIPTYALIGYDARARLERRRPQDITRWPADAHDDVPILAAHRCRSRPPPSKPPPISKKSPDSDIPPY